jgi:hypothetical protein
MTPTPLQAQALLMSATGMSTAEIAARLRTSPASINDALCIARRKATAAGLRIAVSKPEISTPNESGFSALQRLAAEAGLSTNTHTK